jgi:ribokinase
MSSKQQQCLSIYIIGSLNVDLVSYTSRIPNEGETLTSDSFATGWGGKGANQAVATAKLATPSSSATKSRSGGARKIIVKMIGAVGDDEFGSPLKRELGANDIDTTDVRVESGQRTGVAVIMVIGLSFNHKAASSSVNPLAEALRSKHPMERIGSW